MLNGGRGENVRQPKQMQLHKLSRRTEEDSRFIAVTWCWPNDAAILKNKGAHPGLFTVIYLISIETYLIITIINLQVNNK